jgi:cobalt/nickel transport system ATP-binding protein
VTSTTPVDPCVFDVANVSYSYDSSLAAIRNLTLQVIRGERIALLGANGSGKSTLLRLLAGLAFPKGGSISFFGENLTESELQREDSFLRFRRRVGIVFQNPDVQLFNATVFDEVAFGPLQMRWTKSEIAAKVEEQLQLMDIVSLKDRPPYRLSGGEKKRVALASVLVLDPEVLLLDEPIAALDPNSQNQILHLMRSWRNRAKTVITATHDLDTLEDIADRCYILSDGRLEGAGESMSVLHDLDLLERSRLLRRMHHVHEKGTTAPHPHIHLKEGG